MYNLFRKTNTNTHKAFRQYQSKKFLSIKPLSPTTLIIHIIKHTYFSLYIIWRKLRIEFLFTPFNLMPLIRFRSPILPPPLHHDTIIAEQLITFIHLYHPDDSVAIGKRTPLLYRYEKIRLWLPKSKLRYILPLFRSKAAYL